MTGTPWLTSAPDNDAMATGSSASIGMATIGTGIT
jgi:hypothetical protein